MKSKRKINQLKIDAKIVSDGLKIFVNDDGFSVTYPKIIWQSYPQSKKEILKDNIAYSSTLFLPQMFDLSEISYQTSRPMAETFLFKNGIYDMPFCALIDQKPIVEYLKRFVNAKYLFADHRIKTNDLTNFKPRGKKQKTAIIPFSFGKESMLSLALCREMGIKPILVNFTEPAWARESFYISRLIKQFEKEHKIKVNVVNYQAGILRQGKHWNLNTEIGWGLQSTEYVMLCLPFVSYFEADYIFLGNENSCDEYNFHQGVLVYECGYDQNTNWISQQGLLASLLVGRKVEVTSILEPIHEIAITKILHRRYPEYGKYQSSCNFCSPYNENVRWCQNCPKCGSVYTFFRALGVNPKNVGFSADLFDKKHHKLFELFFKSIGSEYFTQDELGLGFYLARESGCTGYSIDKFKNGLFSKIKRNKNKLIKEYLGIHQTKNIPPGLKEKVLKIYRQELND